MRDEPDYLTLGMLANLIGQRELGDELLDLAEMREYRDRDPLAFMVKRIDISGLGLDGETHVESFSDFDGNGHIVLHFCRPGRYVCDSLPVIDVFDPTIDYASMKVRSTWQDEIRLRFPLTLTSLRHDDMNGVAEWIRDSWGRDLDKAFLDTECDCPHRATGEHFNKCDIDGSWGPWRRSGRNSYRDKIKIRTEFEAWELIKAERER